MLDRIKPGGVDERVGGDVEKSQEHCDIVACNEHCEVQLQVHEQIVDVVWHPCDDIERTNSDHRLDHVGLNLLRLVKVMND